MTTDNQETQNEKLDFPIVHDKCPVCGSTKRVTEMLRDEQAAKGKVPKDSPMIALRAMTPIAELPAIMLGLSMIPLLTFDFDVCANPDCGVVYCPTITRQDMPASTLQQLIGMTQTKPAGR